MKQKLQNTLLRARHRLCAFLRRRDPAEYLIALTLAGLFILCLRGMIFGSDALIGLFFKGCDDLFMDFFHPVRDAARGVGVYTELGSIYPPLSNLLIFLLSLVIPEEYLDAPREQAGSFSQYPAAMLCFVFFFLACFLLLSLILQREGEPGAKRQLLTLSLLCSFPFLFLVERGNTMILCLAAMLLFTQNYQSESRAWREVALLSLAFATALKFYPVLLGAVLLADKRWRDALHAAIYGLLFLFLPSLFYRGPVSVFWAIKYTLGFSRASSGLSVDFMEKTGIPLQLGGAVLFGFYIFIILLAALSALLEKKPWKAWMMAGMAMLTMPSIFSSYNWLLLLPALVVFLRSEKLQGKNWLYFFAMTLPFFTYPPRVAQDALLVCCLLALYALYLPEIISNFRNFLKNKKQSSPELS